jgi:hypothetical protein
MLRALLPAFLLLAPMAGAETVTVNVHFDAAAALTKAGERVILSGYFYGEPAPGATMQADEADQIYLSGEEYTIWPKDQTLTFGQSLAAAPLDQVVEPYLNVNIYSARFTSEDNLLDCEIVDDRVKILAKAEHVLTCKLIVG